MTLVEGLLKVESDSTTQIESDSLVRGESKVAHPIYDLLLVFLSNIWPNSAPLRDIKVPNLSDLYFE